MKIKILKGFTAIVGEEPMSFAEGQIAEMPKGADWVRAGLAEPAEGKEKAAGKGKEKAAGPETAAVQPAEAAVPEKPSKREPK